MSLVRRNRRAEVKADDPYFCRFVFPGSISGRVGRASRRSQSDRSLRSSVSLLWARLSSSRAFATSSAASSRSRTSVSDSSTVSLEAIIIRGRSARSTQGLSRACTIPFVAREGMGSRDAAHGPHHVRWPVNRRCIQVYVHPRVLRIVRGTGVHQVAVEDARPPRRNADLALFHHESRL